MNKLRRVTAFILCAFLISAAGCSCKSTGNGGTENKKDAEGWKIPNKALELDEPGVFTGLHDARVGTTGFDLIANGAQQGYTIVVPSNPVNSVVGERANWGAANINSFFNLAAGVMFPIAADDEPGITWSQEGRYLSIGETALAAAAGVTADLGVLGTSGYRVKTVGRSVFMSGAGDWGFGNMYAALDFLKYTIGYDYYDETAIVYDKNVVNLKLPDFDITDVPDFEIRSSGYGMVRTNLSKNTNYRMTQRAEFHAAGTDSTSHSMPQLVPSSNPQYAAHKKWFNLKDKTGADQHCYTAHGDPAEFNAFTDEMVNIVEQKLIEKPNTIIMHFGPSDFHMFCACRTNEKTGCADLYERYGTNAAAMAIWVSDVAGKCEERLFAPGKSLEGRKVIFSIFAYSGYVGAPARKDANGKVQPIDEKVIMNKNCAVFFAPISAYFQYPLSHDNNASIYESGLGWKACAGRTMSWFYDTNFNNYLTPFNSFNSMQQKFKDAKELGSFYMYNQTQGSQNNSTGFCRLKAYLEGKLLWDVNSDVAALTDAWFANYFQEAAGPMREFFEGLRTRLTEIQYYPNFTESWSYDLLQERFWPKGLLDSWIQLMDKAYAAIEPLRLNEPERLEHIADRILLESVCIRYLLISLYGAASYNPGDLYNVKVDLRNDCDLLDINLRGENKEISGLWTDWGI